VNQDFEAFFDEPGAPDAEEVSDPLVYKGDMTPEEFGELQARAEADGFYERAGEPENELPIQANHQTDKGEGAADHFVEVNKMIEEKPDKPCMTAKGLAKLLLEMAEPDAKIIIAESGETIKSCVIRTEYDARGELVLQEIVLFEDR
jgi:hypothetical protein